MSAETGAPVIADTRELSPQRRWQIEINYAEQELKKFHERGRKTTRRFLDERDAIDAAQKWFNIFYANTKILRAALYSQLPQPEVKRKFLDYQDELARVGSIILQRCITPDGDDPRDTFDAVMRQSVMDRLIPGLAAAWLRLETDAEEVELQLESTFDAGEGLEFPNDHHNEPVNSGFKTGPAPDEQSQVLTYKRITDQRVVVDYVYWEDLVWSPCRVWEERRWVGRKVYMNRQELIKRFGEEVGKAVPLSFRPATQRLSTFPEGLTPVHQAIEMACVYEIWDRVNREVIWYCKDYPQLLDTRSDFLNLVGFEPCPKPLFANISTSNTVPRPDYYMIQDQYGELDTINNRISLLIQATKVVGVYDQSSEGVQRMMLEGTDNTLIPVDNWAMFAEKGGVKGQVDWLPLDQVVNALQRLKESREDVKAQIYELTGISDIVRGASKASETLGAQEIKAKFASIRIKDLQDEVAAYAASILRIKAELMVKHFDPEILKRKSNIMRTDDAMLADQAIAMLQSEEGFEWRVLVTADQLAQADYAMVKQERTELLMAVGQYMSQIREVAMAAPGMVTLFVTMLKWAVAGFRGAREIEGLIDRELDSMLKQQQQPPQPQGPSPEEQAAQMDMQSKQADMQMKQASFQMDMAAKQMDLQANQRKHQQDLQYQAQKSALDIQRDMSKGLVQQRTQ